MNKEDFLQKDIELILEDIHFISKYGILSKRYNSRDDLFRFENENILEITRNIGYHMAFTKSKGFFMEEDLLGFELRFGFTTHYNSFDFGLSVINKNRNIKSSAPWGFLVQLMSDGKQKIPKTMFSNYNDIKGILTSAFSIYEDFKSELSKIATVEDEQNLVDTIQIDGDINIARIDSGRTVISSESNEKKFYLEEHILKLDETAFSILIEDSNIIMELKDELNNEILEQVLSQTNAKKNMLGGYDSIDNFSLRYLLVDRYLLVISSGETQPHLFKLFLEGCWKINAKNNIKVV